MGVCAQVWRVCKVNDGILTIMAQHTDGMATAQPAIRDAFLALEKTHIDKYQNMLVACQGNAEHSTDGRQSDPELAQGTPPPDDSPPLVEMESETSLDIDSRSSSAVQGVAIIITKDGKMWLMSSEDQTIPPRTHLGGVGGGSFQARNDRDQGAIPYCFPHGAATLDFSKAI